MESTLTHCNWMRCICGAEYLEGDKETSRDPSGSMIIFFRLIQHSLKSTLEWL